MIENSNKEFQYLIRSEEELLWVGQPQKGIVFRKQDLFTIPFSLCWCGFAVFFFMKLLNSEAPTFLLLLMALFVIYGVFFAFGRFLMDAKLRAHTYYGLTGKRVIIKSGFLFNKTTSLDIKLMSEITLIEQKDGIGTITLGPNNSSTTSGTLGWMPGITLSPRLEMIENASKVYKKILSLQ